MYKYITKIVTMEAQTMIVSLCVCVCVYKRIRECVSSKSQFVIQVGSLECCPKEQFTYIH